MVICPKCGKSLSTQQSLDYHLKHVCKSHINFEKHFDTSFFCDYKGNITYIDGKSAANYGYSQVDLIGRNSYEFIYEPDKEHLYKAHIEFIATKMPQAVQYRRICKDGKLIYVTGCGILDEKSGNITMCEKIIMEENSKNLLMLNLEGNIIEMSSEFLIHFGHHKSDLLGNPILAFISDDTINVFKDAHIQVLANKSSKCTVKFKLMNRNYQDAIIEMYLKCNSISCYLYMD